MVERPTGRIGYIAEFADTRPFAGDPRTDTIPGLVGLVRHVRKLPEREELVRTAGRGVLVEAADYAPERVKVTCVTPLGEEVASTW